MKKRSISVFILAMGILTFNSCTDDAAKKDTKKADKTITGGASIEDELLAMEMSDDNDFMLPSAMRIANMFERAGLEYTPGLTNPVDRKDSYTGRFAQMINFGVYSADLTYCALNDQSQEAQNYMGAVQTMAQKTGMGPIFADESLITRFNSAVGNKDSIQNILIDIHEKTSTFMDNQDLRDVAAIHYSGAWLEGMYLGANDVRSKDNEEIASLIIEQMSVLHNIIKGLKKYPNKHAEMEKLVHSLTMIEESYNNFESTKNFDNNNGDLTLTKEEINKLIDLINDARNNITKTA